MFGLTDDLSNPSDLYRWDPSLLTWDKIPLGIRSRARLVSDIIGHKIVFLGGTNWNNWAREYVDVIYLDERRFE